MVLVNPASIMINTWFKQATHSEAGLLLRFMRELYEHDHTPFYEEQAAAALEKLIANESLGKAWIIHHGDEAVGYLVLALGYSLEYRGRDAFIDEFFISATHRARGLAKRRLLLWRTIAVSLAFRRCIWKWSAPILTPKRCIAGLDSGITIVT